MNDPTRIPRVLEELRATWEGQPDLTLPALFGILANRGAGWGASDEDLVEALRKESALHPDLLPRDEEGRAAGRFLISTTNPTTRVTCSPNTVVIRAGGSQSRQPAAWQYSAIRSTGPGRPLVIADENEIDHRFGVVSLITNLQSDDAIELEGLEREDLGNYSWFLRLDDDRRVILGHKIRIWDASNRDIEHRQLSWHSVVQCVEGAPFIVQPAGGGTAIDLGIVQEIELIEN
ncbi:hypothetical protein QP027_01360 [Corynebacterium breve]|uniref:Uncharacterized protein n=1 Tax=Corynebacterium breve TaxID=3049799 RepID=A0ABY8VIK2_9CORY|nr:hypothetical protein [Corynebacterium breve]WIM68073.1 hypothetical protein QP027_01360 [Corynebacterium breve]